MVTRQRLILGGAGLGLAVIAFAIGRLTAPQPPAKTIDRWHEREVATAAAHTQDVKTAAQDAKTDTHKDVETVYVTRWLPGGVVEQTATQKDKTATATETKAQTTETVTKVETQTVYRDREVVKTVEAKQPNLSIGALAGAKLGDLFKGDVKPVFGGVATWRLIGRVHVGVWGTSDVAGGVALRVDF